MTQELDFYLLTALRGFPVRRGDREQGTLVDMGFGGRGELVALHVDTKDGPRELPLDRGLALGPDALRPAV